MDPISAFVTGASVALIAAMAAHFFTKDRERRKALDERRFRIYMNLLEVHSLYFWFATAELHRTAVSNDVRQKCFSLSWQIADQLRAADDVEYLDEILDVLMGGQFETVVARHDAMGLLVDKLGKKVNPRYSEKLKQISEASVRRLARGDGIASNILCTCTAGCQIPQSAAALMSSADIAEGGDGR